MPSFELVLGPKRDDWLVRTVAALMLAIATGLLRASRREVATEPRVVGLLSAVGVGGVAAFYGARHRISRLYLLDALLQLTLAALWARSLASEPHAPAGEPDRIEAVA